LLHTAIKNWVLNILNSLAAVKWFHSYSDYLVLLWLVDWSDKVKEQLNNTFKYSLKKITEEEYKDILEKRKAEAEAEKKEAEEAANILDESK